jgi:hypothetical protein
VIATSTNEVWKYFAISLYRNVISTQLMQSDHPACRGIASAIVTSVVEPISRGMRNAISNSSEKIMEELLKVVPIDRVKHAVKAYLYPHYLEACRSVAPNMNSYGTFAGEMLVDMMKVRFMYGIAPTLK